MTEVTVVTVATVVTVVTVETVMTIFFPLKNVTIKKGKLSQNSNCDQSKKLKGEQDAAELGANT